MVAMCLNVTNHLMDWAFSLVVAIVLTIQADGCTAVESSVDVLME
jgi:hypothetical protein